MSSRLQAPRDDVLRGMYQAEGMTIAAMAGDLGVAAQTVHNWLRDAQIPTRPSPSSPRCDIGDEEVASRYLNHMETAAEIAEDLGCSQSLVYSRLALLDIERRPAEPRWSPRPHDAELDRLYCGKRLTVGELAERFRVTEQAVYGWLRRADIPLRDRDARERIDADELAQRYLSGASGPELADHYGCSVATIYRRLDDGGVPRRSTRSALDHDALAEALAAGMSAPEIADRSGVSISAVCRALKREGLETATQTAQRRATEHYVTLLAHAERHGTADAETLRWLRERAST